MKISIGTLRRLIREEAMVPGRWYGGEEPEGYDRERVGDPLGMDETDDRMVGDDKGNGLPNPNDDTEKDQIHISDHLRDDEGEASLINNFDETMEESCIINAEIKRWMLQEDPAAASGSDPTGAKGFHPAFDMTKDHTGTDDPNSTWYRSPGRTPGDDGDPFRGPDPHAQLGFHPPDKKDSTSHPSLNGEEGVSARRAPEIWQLNGGSDTSSMLGANAKPSSSSSETVEEPSKETQTTSDIDVSDKEKQNT